MPAPNPTAAPRGGGVWREDVLIERIAAQLRAAFPGLDVGDDDAAVLATADARMLLCTDAAVAGVHVDLEQYPAVDLGYLAVLATLSDLAAMGGMPVALVVALAAPPDADAEQMESGAIEAARAAGCPVVGGNVSLAATASVTAAALGRLPGAPVRRRGARPGDALFVTAPLGGSAAGRRARAAGAALDDPAVLAHRRRRPRLAEGLEAARLGASAMLDVSDGFVRDARRLALASGVAIDLGDVPLATGASLEDALGGGEDYELLIAHPDPAALRDGFARAGLGEPLRVGEVLEGGGVTRRGAGLADLGWRHGG